MSGFNTEYSGVKFAFFFLGEYTAMIIISCVAVTVFFGGWLPPFPHVAALKFLEIVPPFGWFLIKVGGLPLRLHLVPLDVPALPLRPAHGAGLEVDDPDRAREHRRRGGRDPRYSRAENGLVCSRGSSAGLRR